LKRTGFARSVGLVFGQQMPGRDDRANVFGYFVSSLPPKLDCVGQVGKILADSFPVRFPSFRLELNLTNPFG
jgi:hypothetical protein